MDVLRVCKKCGREKPLEEFSKSKSCHYGRGWTCIECTNAKALAYHYADPERAKAHRKRQREKNKQAEAENSRSWREKMKARAWDEVALPKSKVCSKCGIEKPSDQFARRATAKSGLRSDCKECQRVEGLDQYYKHHEDRKERSRAWYATNKEEAAASNARWMQENASARSAWKKAYYAENAEEITRQTRECRARDPERHRRTNREWKRRNPEQCRQLSHARRAKKVGAGGNYTKADVQRIYRQQRGKCGCCRKRLGKEYHVDHIRPIALGGNNSASNIQILCGPCNHKKHAKDPLDFMREQGFLL